METRWFSRVMDKDSQDFTSRLRRAKGLLPRRWQDAPKHAAASSSWGVGFQIMAELIAGPLVGAGLGYALDRWWNTTPWVMLVGILLGIGAAMLNIYRIWAADHETTPPNPSVDPSGGTDRHKDLDGH